MCNIYSATHVGPLSTCNAPLEGGALIVLLPGALLEPRDYRGLVHSMQVEHAACFEAAAVVAAPANSAQASGVLMGVLPSRVPAQLQKRCCIRTAL